MELDIEKSLKSRFLAPLPENYQRRIIFWQDPDGEFSDYVDDLALENVEILKLNGSNNFYAKMLLSDLDTEHNYLVYNPVSYSDIKENWLLDVELYSEEFRADLVSIRMEDLDIPDTLDARKTIKSYSKFFENKERVAKLYAFKSNYTVKGQFNKGQFNVDIIAALCGTEDNTLSGVVREILQSGLEIEDNTAMTNIKKFGHEETLWKMVNKYFGYEYSEELSLINLASFILITALSFTVQPNVLQNFQKYIPKNITESQRQLCYSTVNEWLHSDDDAKLYYVTREVEEHLNIEEIFDSLEVKDLINSEVFPCINECILRKFMSEISEDVVKPEEIIKTVEKRRTLKWYKRVRYYFNGIYEVANMQNFYLNYKEKFHEGEYKDLWKNYCDEYYKMDTYYRNFHLCFGKTIKEISNDLTDMFKNVADFVEKLYKNWFLTDLGMQWTTLIKDEVTKSPKLENITNQTEFYKNFVKPIEMSGSRAYVIISDALRYEVAAELTEQLIKETKGNPTIKAVQSVFPSVTKFGMPALLPHKDLTLSDDLKVLCDGLSTEGTENREIVLNKQHIGNIAVTYKSLIGMKQSERRELVNQASVVYIYHNAIDAVGDKAVTEDQVFDACTQAISELKNLVRLITNDLSGSNILITADHGFLYSYKPLTEIDKAEKDFINGNVLELDRRYVIAEKDCSAEFMMKIPFDCYQSKYIGFAPYENIRMKKQGGGMNYVHGGLSLQEIVVPVIEFKNMRSTSKKFVDVKKAEIQLISQSRKISNSIFSLDFYQTEPVGGKILPATYSIYFADEDGRIISDTKTVIADNTENNGESRVIRTRFTLKSYEYKKTDTYYMTVIEKDTNNIISRIEFTIDIAFVNDFDF